MEACLRTNANGQVEDEDAGWDGGFDLVGCFAREEKYGDEKRQLRCCRGRGSATELGCTADMSAGDGKTEGVVCMSVGGGSIETNIRCRYAGESDGRLPSFAAKA